MKKYFLFFVSIFLIFLFNLTENKEQIHFKSSTLKTPLNHFKKIQKDFNDNEVYVNDLLIDEIVLIKPEDFKGEESSSENNIERAFCLFNCYKPQYKEDGWEKNNYMDNASKVGVFLDSNVMSSWTGTLHDVSKDEKDIDFYHIKLNYERQLRIELKNIPYGNDYDLYLYKKKRNTFSENEYTLMGQSRNGTNLDEFIITDQLMEAGEYIIKVESFYGLSNSEYTILTHAGIPNRSVSLLNSGKANIVTWKRNFPQSKVYLKNLFEVYYVPYKLLYELSKISQYGEEELAVLLETYLGVKTNDDYQQFMEDSVGIMIGSLLTSFLGAENFVINLILSIFGGGLSKIVLDNFEKKLYEQRLDGLFQVINQALTEKVGLSYEIFHNCGLGSNNEKYHSCNNSHIAYETEFSIFRNRNVYSEYRLNTEPNRYPTMDSMRDVYGELRAWIIK